MNRPNIICHMVTSIDGKVTGEFLSQVESQPAEEHYYQINREIQAEAYACGRVTMEESFTSGWYPDLTPFAEATAERTDHIADRTAKRYAVALTAGDGWAGRGRVLWMRTPDTGMLISSRSSARKVPRTHIWLICRASVCHIFLQGSGIWI